MTRTQFEITTAILIIVQTVLITIRITGYVDWGIGIVLSPFITVLVLSIIVPPVVYYLDRRRTIKKWKKLTDK